MERGAISGGDLYAWRADSTYIQEPTFFQDMGTDLPPVQPIVGARVLAVMPDSTTTDHISPAGAIAPDSPAGQFLTEKGVPRSDWNSYGSRRGNHEVMMPRHVRQHSHQEPDARRRRRRIYGLYPRHWASY